MAKHYISMTLKYIYFGKKKKKVLFRNLEYLASVQTIILKYHELLNTFLLITC